jgi:hypothetical protein
MPCTQPLGQPDRGDDVGAEKVPAKSASWDANCRAIAFAPSVETVMISSAIPGFHN